MEVYFQPHSLTTTVIRYEISGLPQGVRERPFIAENPHVINTTYPLVVGAAW